MLLLISFYQVKDYYKILIYIAKNSLIKLFFFFIYIYIYMNIVLTNKYNKKLQSPGALNIKETPGYKQKDNLKNNK